MLNFAWHPWDECGQIQVVTSFHCRRKHYLFISNLHVKKKKSVNVIGVCMIWFVHFTAPNSCSKQPKKHDLDFSNFIKCTSESLFMSRQKANEWYLFPEDFSNSKLLPQDLQRSHYPNFSDKICRRPSWAWRDRSLAALDYSCWDATDLLLDFCWAWPQTWKLLNFKSYHHRHSLSTLLGSDGCIWYPTDFLVKLCVLWFLSLIQTLITGIIFSICDINDSAVHNELYQCLNIYI